MKESYSDLTLRELVTKREDLKKEYRTVRFNIVMGHVENPVRKRTLRRKIARLNTVIHEYALGMRTDAGAKQE